MLHPLTIVLLIIYALLIGTAATSIAANHYRAPHVPGQEGKEGVLGDSGVTGIQGDPGPTGLTGAFLTVSEPLHGVTGRTGPTGTALIVGPTGTAGTTGPTGPGTGARGLPGPRGRTPFFGVTGPTGGPGPQGATGPTGPQTSGPVFLNLLYSYNAGVTGGSNSIPVGSPPMTLVHMLPVTLSSEFTLGPTGRIGFTVADTSYLVRIGLDLNLSGLTGAWQPTSVSLVNFPMPPGMPLVTLWPTATSTTTAATSLGATLVYTTPSVVPMYFEPQILLIISNSSPSTSVRIALLSITIEHASA